jgi:hypothetical protein
MIPKARKINQSAYALLSKMIQVLTYSYPDSTFIGPRLFVLFTNFNKYEEDSDSEPDISSEYSSGSD